MGIHLVDELSFSYHDSTYLVMMEAPDGEFSEEEEEEVIDILASFRVVDEEASAMEENAVYEALQRGDFSHFAGTYKPCDVYNDWYGGGQDISNLILQENGIITGGGSWFHENPYPETKPMSVTKREDGSYLCQVTYVDDYMQEYFLIYPQGVIGENPYGDNDPLLTENVYIQYMVYDGSVMDIIYYKIEN